MKNKSLLLAIVSLVLIPMALNAWDTRLLGLGNPSLTIGDGLPSAMSSFVGFLPTDQYNTGLSMVPDASDIFTDPQLIGNVQYFPGISFIADWSGATPNGGLVMRQKGSPMTFALFLMRPGNNSFAIGTPRGAFTNLGSFATDSTLLPNITSPVAPTNIADFFFSYKLGNILFGASGGFAYGLAAGLNGSIQGTANSNVTNSSGSWAATGRLGASMPLGPAAFDASLVVVGANATATQVTGATPPGGFAANQNNKLTATNVSLAVNVRGTLPLADTLNLAAVGNFSMLPQNFTASNAAGPINSTTALIAPSGIWSAGAGTGITWKATDAFVISGYLSGIVGAGNWVAVITGPNSSTFWVTLKPLLNGEIKPASWLTLRGGVSYSATYNTTTINQIAGGTNSTTVTWNTGVAVSAGCSVQVTDKAVLEMVINLSNFTNGGNIQASFVETSLKMDL
jgi:hypothetical protein